MDEFMDTVDPRIERAFTKTGHHRPVHVPTYRRAWAFKLVALAIILVAIATIIA
jgi:hypothetical protein